jgi:hypothetical protein
VWPVLVLVLVAGAPAPAKLVVDRGPCADAELGPRVEERLGYSPFSADADDEVHVVIQPGPRGTVTLRGARAGERSLEAPTCEALAEALAFAIAVALDPVSALRPAEPDAPPPDAARPTTKPPASTTSPPKKKRFRRTKRVVEGAPAALPVALELVVAPLFTVGSSPDPTVGLSLGAGVRGERFSLYLDARADVPSTKLLDGSTGGIRGSVVTATAAPCLQVELAALCLTASGGAVYAEGVDLREVRAGWSPLVTTGLRAWLELRTRSVLIRPGVEFDVGLLRPQLVDSSTGVVLSEPGLAQLLLFVQGAFQIGGDP